MYSRAHLGLAPQTMYVYTNKSVFLRYGPHDTCMDNHKGIWNDTLILNVAEYIMCIIYLEPFAQQWYAEQQIDHCREGRWPLSSCWRQWKACSEKCAAKYMQWKGILVRTRCMVHVHVCVEALLWSPQHQPIICAIFSTLLSMRVACPLTDQGSSIHPAYTFYPRINNKCTILTNEHTE